MKTFVTNTSIYRIEKREHGELDMYREYYVSEANLDYKNIFKWIKI